MITIVETKFCPICKTWYPRPSGKSDKVWKKQKYCGSNCANISKRKENPKRPRRSNLIPGEGRYQGWQKRKKR